MKTYLCIIMLWTSLLSNAQNEEIPTYFLQKIKENPNYLGLYLGEIEGEILYYFIKPPLPGADRINTTIFYNKDGKEVNSSSTGGYSGRPKNFKPFKKVKTIWEKEIYPMKNLLTKKLKLEYHNNYNIDSPFKFVDDQMLYFSYKNGIQLLNKGKVVKTYKIIPINFVHFCLAEGINTPTENVPANACFFEYNDSYWLLVAITQEDFELRPTDENGKILNHNKVIFLSTP